MKTLALYLILLIVPLTAHAGAAPIACCFTDEDTGLSICNIGACHGPNGCECRSLAGGGKSFPWPRAHALQGNRFAYANQSYVERCADRRGASECQSLPVGQSCVSSQNGEPGNCQTLTPETAYLGACGCQTE